MIDSPAPRKGPRPTFSVIVPSLNEEGTIERTLLAARSALGESAELVVADGGSRDRTRFRAAPHARVISVRRGRGAQLNAGALEARGDILLFLHADTRLERGTGLRILRALEDPAVVGGCCRFALDPPARFPSQFLLLQAGVNLRTRLFRTATGDQAIFATRAAFERVGGFPDYPLFEDVAFVRSLRRVGRFRPISSAAHTSRRRWERRGFWRTVWLHWILRTAFWLRVSPHRLETWYRQPGGEPRSSSSARALDRIPRR
ncbi:MAG: TIGR04283 family arsenosugar biosynthesis glycosyltransferase [Gemmatimonadota bacterium]